MIFVSYRTWERGEWVSHPLFILEKSRQMNNSLTTAKFREIAEKVTNNEKLELVHIDVFGAKKSPTVRVFIDKPEGVTHEDCAKVSREIGAILETEDFISSAYILEVSSPGIERGLYKIEDFQKFVGENAKVKTDSTINGQKNFRGKIVKVEDQEIVFDDVTNGEVRFPFAIVNKANLEADYDEELKSKK